MSQGGKYVVRSADERDPEYVGFLRRNVDVDAHAFCFGADVVELFDPAVEATFASIAGSYKEEMLVAREDKRRKELVKLKEQLEALKRTSGFSHFLHTAKDAILEYLEEEEGDLSLRIDTASGLDPDSIDINERFFVGLNNLFERGELTDEDLIQILSLRVRFLNDANEQYSQKWEQCKEKFISVAKALDLPIDDETIDERLRFVSFIFADPLLCELEKIGGMFDPNEKRVYINMRFASQPDRFEHIFVHELYHAISAFTLLRIEEFSDAFEDEDEDADAEEGESFVEFIQTRVGLMLGNISGSSAIQITESFRWLNEAITEELAQLHMNSVHGDIALPDCYNDERILYGLLQSKGTISVAQAVFYSAYFGGAENQRLMRDVSRRAYGKDFFTRLDRYVTEFGVEVAVNFMTSYDPARGIP